MPVVSLGYADSPQGQKLLAYYGPIIWVNLGFDKTWKPEQKRPPQASITNLDALVDTGAIESCIDRLLAAQLKLPVVDREEICGVHGSKEVDIHIAQVHVPSLKFTVHGRFAAVELKEGGHRQQILLGRTFLSHFTLTYTGKSGGFTLSS